MKRRVYIMLIVIAFALIIVYASLLISVLPVIRDVKAILLNKKPAYSSEVARYDTSFLGTDVIRKVRLTPLLALHNFKEGIIYVNYSAEVWDQEGNCIWGSWMIESKWYIRKDDGQWVITDVIESP